MYNSTNYNLAEASATIIQDFRSHSNKKKLINNYNKFNNYFESIPQSSRYYLIAEVLNLIEEHYYKVCIYNIISLRKTLGLVCKNFEAKLLISCNIPEEINYKIIQLSHNSFPFEMDDIYLKVSYKYNSLKAEHIYNKYYKFDILISDIYNSVHSIEPITQLG